MNKKTLQKQIDSYTGDDLAGFLYNLFESERQIKAAIARAQRDIEVEEERHEAALAECRQNLANLQRDCPHGETKFYPDASGGNDSETHCLWCGKNL